MAAIDKIYGTTEQFDELYDWLEEHYQELLPCLYPRDGYTNDKDRPISNFPVYADKWLMANCPLDWVKEKILEQYNGHI